MDESTDTTPPLLALYDPIRAEELRIMGFRPAVKTQPVLVKRMDHDFACETRHGLVRAKAGDFKAVQPTGEEYPISAEDFERDYLEVTELDDVDEADYQEPTGFPAEIATVPVELAGPDDVEPPLPEVKPTEP